MLNMRRVSTLLVTSRTAVLKSSPAISQQVSNRDGIGLSQLSCDKVCYMTEKAGFVDTDF